MATHIIWDNDGLLVDTEGLYFQATQEVMRQVGYELTEQAYREHFLKSALGTWHVLQSQGVAEPEIERMRAFVCVLSVRMPICAPVILTAL